MSDLGPQPDASIEPGEPAPGGPDAVASPDGENDTDGTPEARDPDPQKNPMVEDALPDDVTETEDTETAATQGKDAPDEEAPA